MPRPTFALGILALAALGACHATQGAGAPQIVQPGAPGQPTRVISAEKATDLSRVQFTPADVRFMQGMIGHHAQALEMTALLPERTERDDMRMLAMRIEVSQADEIQMMQRWLEARGQDVPGPHAHHAPGAPLMPGMLTRGGDGAARRQRDGAAFDRLFLESMIKHHEGALTMVKELTRRRAPGRNRRSTRSRRTSTPISAWRSSACARCWQQMQKDKEQ